MSKRNLFLVMLLSVSTCAVAHHSFAMFDITHRATLHGKVRAIEWTNPHVWIWVDRPNATGAPTPFGFELASPGEITRNYGWKKDSLTVGEEVTIEYAPLRSGRNGGALARVTRSNGQVLYGTAEHLLAPKPGEKPAGKPADKPAAGKVEANPKEGEARENA